jgi:hypothetical protein
MEVRSAALADAGVSAERLARLESELSEMRGLGEPVTEKGKARTARRSRKPEKPSG